MKPLPGKPTRDLSTLAFHPQQPEEYNIPASLGGMGNNQIANQLGYRPKYREYQCGACGNSTTGRVLCDVERSDGAMVQWCQCSCDKKEPTIIVDKAGVLLSQLPMANEFSVSDKWPPDLAKLYEEGAKSLSAGAYTACAMVCRKLLMATACHEGDTDGKGFVEYVKYITDTVLTFPKAKDAIDKIRGIGNEANHNVAFVSPDDARRAMQIVTYMLNTIYSLPAA
jgi:hypothetical protein